MKILVVDGAGYMGSHMAKHAFKLGHEVTTLDNFSTGYRDAVIYGGLIEADLADRDVL